MRGLRTRAVKVVDRTAYTLQELCGAKPGSRYLRHWCERLSAAVAPEWGGILGVCTRPELSRAES